MDEVGQLALGAERAIAEEDEIVAAHDGQCHVVAAGVDEQPVAASAGRSRQLRVDQAEAGDVDHAGMDAGVFTRALEALDQIAARHRHDELAAAAVERDARHPRYLRVLDSKRRRLLHLPVNQLIEILRLRRDLLEAYQRDFRRRVRNHQRDAASPGRDLLQRRLQRRHQCRVIVNVRRVERRGDDTGAERLDGVAVNHRLAGRL